jgi:hypothetical protein
VEDYPNIFLRDSSAFHNILRWVQFSCIKDLDFSRPLSQLSSCWLKSKYCTGVSVKIKFLKNDSF